MSLRYLIAMELMQDSVYCSPQEIVGTVLTLLKAVVCQARAISYLIIKTSLRGRCYVCVLAE